jgi:hypothetical protein
MCAKITALSETFNKLPTFMSTGRSVVIPFSYTGRLINEANGSRYTLIVRLASRACVEIQSIVLLLIVNLRSNTHGRRLLYACKYLMSHGRD